MLYREIKDWSPSDYAWIEEAAFWEHNARCRSIAQRCGVGPHEYSREAWAASFRHEAKPNPMGVCFGFVWIAGPTATDAVTYAARLRRMITAKAA